MADKADLTGLFDRLSRSAFRRRFRLFEPERGYLHRIGLDAVFIAQHATATCCRGCLEQWHSIRKGRALTLEEKEYILVVLKTGLGNQASHAESSTPIQSEVDFGDSDSF